MRVRSIGSALAAAMLSVAAGAAAQAAEQTLVDRVRGWEIERAAGATGPHPCQMSKSYKDKNDGNAENVIVFGMTDDSMVISLGYEKWAWDKNEAVPVSMLLDSQPYGAKSKWIGDGATLSTKLPAGLAAKLMSAKALVLRFKDGDADFDLAGYPAAYEAFARCEKAAVEAPAKAAPLPSDGRMKAYLFGLMLQENVKECDVKTTAKQRAGLDARVATLQPEMVVVEPSLRDSLKNRPGVRCPTASDAGKFEETLQSYIDKVPEDFAAEMDKKAPAAETPAPKP